MLFFLVYPVLVIGTAVFGVVCWYRTRSLTDDERSVASFERQRDALRGGQR